MSTYGASVYRMHDALLRCSDMLMDGIAHGLLQDFCASSKYMISFSMYIYIRSDNFMFRFERCKL